MMERKRILRIFGYFLALMLVLTVLSRAFASMTVARVKTSSPGNMAIYHEVSAAGTVEAAGEIAVSTEPGQKVSGIAVEEGDRVSAGDVLFEVDRGELDEQLLACRRELETLRLAIRDAKSARKLAAQKREQAIARAGEDYDTAVRQGDQSVDRAARELDRAQRELWEFQNSLPAVGEAGETDAGSEKALAAAVDAAEKSYEDAVNTRDESVRTARRALEDAREAEIPDSTVEQKKLERAQKKRELAKLERMSDEGGKVKAPAEGVVTGINIAVGGTTGEDAAVLLADLSRGCRFVAKIDREQAEYVKPHAQVMLTDEMRKEKIEKLEVDSVTADDDDPDLLEVTVKLPAGKLEVGSGAQMTVRQKSGTYEMCIPIQALNEGGGECFVYVTEERETVLGKRLAAKKLAVQVADRNENFAALTQGSLSASQKVITSASRSISEGSPVRLEEP